MNNTNMFSSRSIDYRLCMVALVAALALISGCQQNSPATAAGTPMPSAPTPTQNTTPPAATPSLSGAVYGGQQPIVGATVVMYAAGATPGDAAAQISTGSVTTGSTGHFTLNFNDPDPGQIVYLVVSGGKPDGATENDAIALMTVAGAWCDAATDTTCTFPASVNINELTTVAATAVLQDHMNFVDCSTVAGTTITTPGATCVNIPGALDLARTAKTFNNLADVATGRAPAFLTAQADGTPINTTLRKLESLADILAGCVNSTDAANPVPAQCTALFAEILPVPANTLEAAWDIAAAPVNNRNGVGLYARIPASPVWTDIVGTAPDDWTVGGQRFAYAANKNGNDVSAWRLSTLTGGMAPVTSGGAGSCGSAFERPDPGNCFAAGSQPSWVTVDPRGRFVYAANYDGDTVSAYAIDPATGALAPVSGSPFPAADALAVAVDPSGRFAYIVNQGDNNVSAYAIDPTTGALAQIGSPVATEILPVSVTVDPTGRYVYVTNSCTTFLCPPAGGSISAYAINASSGALHAIGSAINTGENPQSVTVDPSGRFAYVANNIDGNISAYTINTSTGALSDITGISCGTDLPDNCVATGGDPTSIAIDPTGRFAYVANGNDGTVWAYAINPATGALTPIGSPVSASDPQSVTVDPSGRFAYVADGGDRRMSAYSIDSGTGALTELDAGSPFAAGSGVADLRVGAAGRYAYAVNQLGGDVSVYRIDAASGALQPIVAGSCGVVPNPGNCFAAGSGPYSLALAPAGRFLYVPASNDDQVLAYRVDAATGLATPVPVGPCVTGGLGNCIAAGADPRSAVVDPAGKFLYVANSAGSSLSAYVINAGSGALTAINGSDPCGNANSNCFASGSSSYGPAIDANGHLYVANYGDDNVSIYDIDADSGALTALTTAAAGNGAGWCVVDPASANLYVANDLAATISAFKIATDGTLTGNGAAAPLSAADAPNEITMGPPGRYAFTANDTNPGSVSVFAVNTDGTLSEVTGSPFAAGTYPTGVWVDPTGRYVYVTNSGSNTVSAYTLDPATGALAPVAAGSPFAAGSGPVSVAVGQ